MEQSRAPFPLEEKYSLPSMIKKTRELLSVTRAPRPDELEKLGELGYTMSLQINPAALGRDKKSKSSIFSSMTIVVNPSKPIIGFYMNKEDQLIHAEQVSERLAKEIAPDVRLVMLPHSVIAQADRVFFTETKKLHNGRKLIRSDCFVRTLKGEIVGRYDERNKGLIVREPDDRRSSPFVGILNAAVLIRSKPQHPPYLH